MRLTEAEYAALLRQGHVREIATFGAPSVASKAEKPPKSFLRDMEKQSLNLEPASSLKTLTVILDPLETVSEKNRHEHWRAKAARTQQQRSLTLAVLLHTFGRTPTWESGWTIYLTRIAPRRLDGDNLQRALSAVRDGVAEWLRIDDGSERLMWDYAQEKGVPWQYAVRVVLVPTVGKEVP
jgi:hypothetical protein